MYVGRKLWLFCYARTVFSQNGVPTGVHLQHHWTSEPRLLSPCPFNQPLTTLTDSSCPQSRTHTHTLLRVHPTDDGESHHLGAVADSRPVPLRGANMCVPSHLSQANYRRMSKELATDITERT